MRSYLLRAAAKINLYLEIVGDHLTPGPEPQPTGYHALIMVLQSIDLADIITVQSLDTEAIRVRCDHPEVPNNEQNLAYRAAQLMREQFPQAWAQFGGLDIHIEKNIPVGAGLAGGSTDAAAVLVGIDLLWDLGLTKPELRDLAGQLGSDVPFCIAGGTALALGRGEQLSPLADLDNLHLVLGKFRSLTVATPWAYQTYRHQFGHTYVSQPDGQQERQQQVHAGPLIQAIARRDPQQIGQRLRNDLERVVLPAHPEVAQLREIFQAASPLGAMMSGSGPTVFALATSLAEAEAMKQEIEKAIALTPGETLRGRASEVDLWVARLIPMGIQVVD